MHVSAPPPSLADMRLMHPVDGIKNQDAQSKFSSVAPKDQVTMSPAARALKKEEDRNYMEQFGKPKTSLTELSTEEWLDQRLDANKTMSSGITLTRASNLSDEFALDARLYLDSVFEFAVSQARSLKADSENDAGSGDSINLLLKKAATDPALAHMNEARQKFKMNTDYDTIRMMSSKPSNAQPNETDEVSVDDLGKNLDARFQLHNMNKPNLPNANTAMAMKKYAEVAQNLEV